MSIHPAREAQAGGRFSRRDGGFMLGDEQPPDRGGDGEDSPGGSEQSPKPRGWPKGKPRKLRGEPMIQEANQPVDPMEGLKLILSQLSESNREQMMEFAC